ncbi:MAG TPA: helix-turn-helix transcriptional regulator [Clostridiaceae bacterium]|nr:helix-turn-helix transcriptional regulator [Clostridiaceae bacterium]
MNPITLELLSKKFYLSKFYISRIFIEITGFSVFEYLQHRRIIEAQKMLKNSRKEIADICYDCGFNNIQYFYLVFKKMTRTAPYKYRKH